MIEKIERFDIEGLVVITPKIFEDSRGYFCETFNERDFKAIGINVDKFVQDNESKSSKNVLRGLHFQAIDPQAKLVRVIKGEVYDVAVDLRADSKTYGKWQGVLLSETNRKQFFIPRGFAHGFAVVSDEAVFAYKCDNFWNKEGERGIKWDDADLNIDWNNYIDVNCAQLSDKDRLYPSLSEWTKGLDKLDKKTISSEFRK
ncbi:MAG: dTDP-4-dehydrorhamnose 3,5-epimerase [Firmicutes bacterium]|nr:dTDP-4-dehydrorhamnose 3,5-epimerase [Bacillota bacterium]